MSSKTDVLGFEDSWKKNRHVFGSTKSLAKVMYLDGQQSKQDEVDKLQKRIEDALKELEYIHFYKTQNSDNAIKILKGDSHES